MKKTERIAVWLTPEQIEWLKTKKNSSETVRAAVTEAMNLDRLKESVKTVAAGVTPAGARTSRSRGGGTPPVRPPRTAAATKSAKKGKKK